MDNIKVLVIEDNKYVHEIIKSQLEKSPVWHFAMDFAMTMEEALQKKKTGDFDIVLSDLVLPDSTKISTLHILRQEFSSLPFIILTSDDDDNLLVQSIEIGARNYLSKDYLQLGSLLSRTLYNALEHWKMESELKYLANHDELTGAYNKRYFSKILSNQIRSSQIMESPFCLAICDLDNFRQINNNYGHVAGDKALKLFVETIEETIRNKDKIGRFGGDEFCILFPDTETDKCSLYLKKLAGLKIDIPGGIQIHGSYGGVQYKEGMTSEELIIEADKALYQVKNEGKGFSKML